jgi:hypothetical protein
MANHPERLGICEPEAATEEVRFVGDLGIVVGVPMCGPCAQATRDYRAYLVPPAS